MPRKSDSFFIRAELEFNDNVYQQASIDLGAYVDALGKSVLRILGVEVSVGVGALNQIPLPAVGNVPQTWTWQLTTQSQAALVTMNDKATITNGTLAVARNAGSDVLVIDDTVNANPARWTNGYLIGVEQIYLGADSSDIPTSADPTVTVMMECEVETLTQNAAMALALSQQ